MSEDDNKYLHIGDKVIKLILPDLSVDELDPEDFLSIHYFNVYGEILTSSVLLNRIGILLAEADAEVRSSLLGLRTLKDEIKEKKAVTEIQAYKDLKDEGVNSPTIPQVNARVLTNQDVKDLQNNLTGKRLEYIEIKKTRDIINSFYWSMKSKDEKLLKLTDKLRPEDFSNEIIEERVNYVQIKVKKEL